jgi:spore germination protein KC
MYKYKFSKYKKLVIIVCILMNCFLMSSCFSYKDINRILFVTALMIDVDADNRPVVYAEAFRGIRAAGPEGMDQRVIFKGTGKTVFEAVRDMNAVATFKLNFTQNKAIIFTIRAAESGLEDFIDFLDRDQELLVRPYIVVFRGDPEKLMKLEMIQEKYIGTLIRRIIENIGASSRAVTISFNEFYNQRSMGDKTNVVTILQIRKDSLDPKLEVSGGAVIKNDRMVSILTREEGQGFNFMMDNVKSGTLEITNPSDINKFITLEIKSSDTKTGITYNNKIIKLKKKIKVKVDFCEAQKRIVLTKENINRIKEKSASNIEKACNNVFQKYKGIGIDIFDIKDGFYAKYPKEKIENVINVTQLEVEAEVEIMNTGDIKNFE